ncbi:3-phosphoshikimate 1-carboxyvinyltransferase [Taibaiella chishuiensis]|uniref:3-phosphoshikimate 1-carboxyvinyltransferase n=1 Tax=Taibaiella chishuiensis TaxID=1434707 RepID=A0A2P8D5R2_9BACT|nr:3-phosphoshikimate 1-carboxyvinyltransferase [Taibaiella chishuiensis]PSK92565.1 3-phosphoshikimate 1-carboxyvinyltransferase [Taibaiella chishuiensis]
MEIKIKPGAVKGTVMAPASKSVMQRACAAALLKGGETVIRNYGRSNDDQAALQIITDLGATVNYTDDDTLTISSAGIKAAGSVIHCGESGLSVRMFTPIVALLDRPMTITGAGSLLTRPMSFWDTLLPQLGVVAASDKGCLPLQVQGPLQPADIHIDGGLSSQFLTGLLFAYAGAGASGKRIVVEGLKSRPYVDLTLKIMKDFGLPAPVNQQYESFYFPEQYEKSDVPRKVDFTVEADWSSAAMLMVAGAIAGSVTVKGLDVFSEQADKKVLEALQDCGCHLSIQVDEVTVRKNNLKPFHFDATHCPDLFPPLVALAACCAGTSVIEGVDRLVHKESNRALTLQEEFGKMGITITLQDDKMLIKGGAIRGAVVHSRHDHRIAMACAVAALAADGPVLIEAAEAVSKSYPRFFDDLESLATA